MRRPLVLTRDFPPSSQFVFEWAIAFKQTLQDALILWLEHVALSDWQSGSFAGREPVI